MYVEQMGQVGSVKPAVKPAAEKVLYAKSMDGEAEYKTEGLKDIQKEIENPLMENPAGDNERTRKVIEKMNAQLSHAEAKFGIHEATNRVMIKLVDKDTQEVIKEIPPEKTLDMIAKCMELAGVLVDEKL